MPLCLLALLLRINSETKCACVFIAVGPPRVCFAGRESEPFSLAVSFASVFYFAILCAGARLFSFVPFFRIDISCCFAGPP